MSFPGRTSWSGLVVNARDSLSAINLPKIRLSMSDGKIQPQVLDKEL
jgi:hypothetical protein